MTNMNYVETFESMVKAGIPRNAVVSLLTTHLASLKNLPASAEIKAAIRQTEALLDKMNMFMANLEMFSKMDFKNGLNALGFLAQFGVEVTMVKPNTFKVGGFYKSGTVTVEFTNDKPVVTARYEEVSEVYGSLLETLINLNNEWYERSKDRFSGWEAKDPAWAEVDLMYRELKNL